MFLDYRKEGKIRKNKLFTKRVIMYSLLIYKFFLKLYTNNVLSDTILRDTKKEE